MSSLSVRHISKSFAGIKALDDVSMELYPGKVNAIIGENGAGKSTLMKILSGVYTSYEGSIFYNGVTQKFNSTKDAEEAGIAIIHQELNLVQDMSVAENIFLGRELLTSWGTLDKDAMELATKKLLGNIQLEVAPQQLVGQLKVGQQQLVEIAKALYTKASVIIMDEPTSAISDKEVAHLMSIIAKLKEEGKIIVYISHKFQELFAIADHYVVLRDGKTIDAGNMKDITEASLIEKMTGRTILYEARQNDTMGRSQLLSVRGWSLRSPFKEQRALLDQIQFDLHEGEVLGIYGLMGAGRTELLESLFGLHPKRTQGQLNMKGQALSIDSPEKAIQAGIALVPEDRKRHGLVLDHSIKNNISVTILQQLERWGLTIHAQKELQHVRSFVEKLQIKLGSVTQKAGSLSGGNQQKVVLSKWLSTKPVVLLLDEPTRGIDVHAKAEIYKLIRSLAADGMGIVMVSSELPEILAVSDRVMVMAEGRVTATLPIQDCTENTLLKFALPQTN